MNIKILLRYAKKVLDKPILAEVIRKTKAKINILHAELNARKGEILIGVEGPEAEIKKVIKLFEGRGVKAEKLEHLVVLDRDICTDCGACVSLCPTGALSIAKDYSVKLDEDKCILCEVCVPACPVRAIKVKRP
jgi:ferredoxin